MGKKTIFQPDHLGRRTPDIPGKSLARSHGIAAETAARHGDKPNIARDASRGAHTYDLKIHGGMSKQTKSGSLAFGGDHASALDSLSGLTVLPDKSGAAATAHPLTTPPKAKNLSGPVAITPGMRSRSGKLDTDTVRELGKRMMAEAACDSGDRMALSHYGVGTLRSK